MNDEELLTKFDNLDLFRNERDSWDWQEQPLFCRLARAVHKAGLDWWHINVQDAIRFRFGLKSPNGTQTVHVGGVRGRPPNTFSFNGVYNFAGLPNLDGAQPLSAELVNKIVQSLEAGPDFPAEWNLGDREGLWPVDYAENEDEAPGNAGDEDRAGTEAGSYPLNAILYGPPGTGKTYRTTSEAVRLCGEPVPEDREAMVQTYQRLLAAGRIEFVTFHQSMSYEDFVEGRQPMTGSDEDDASSSAGFRLETVPGIFRRIAKRAETSRGPSPGDDAIAVTGRRVFKMSIGEANNPEDAHLFEDAIAGGYTLLGFEDIDWSDDKYADRKAIIEACKAEGELDGHTDVNAQSGAVQMPFIFRNWVHPGDIVVVSRGNSLFRAIGEFTGDYEFHPRPEGGYAHRRPVRWHWVDREGVSVSEIYKRGFSQKTIYQFVASDLNVPALERYLNSQQTDGPAEPESFVLIIDEINRANISKVFGELITLLEPDKRLGQPNALKVRLPYSGDNFGVPSNLHILGTMNTADRSIALLDTALRRRFTFREMMPDSSLLTEADKTCGLDLPKILDTINERIEYLYDREHQIGHAYFIDCKSPADVDAVMRHRVIPLLAEYFFEDWEKIAAVLGDAAPNDGSIASGFLKCSKLKSPPGLEDGDALSRFRWEIRSEDEGFDYRGLTEA